MFLPHFDVFCDLLLNRRTATWNLFVLYNNETNYHRKIFLFQNLFISKPFNITRKPAFCHFGKHEEKPFDVIYYLYKLKQSHWLLCVAKNCDWSRKITPLSNLTRASLLVEWKLTAKAELNCEIYKSYRKYWKSQVSFGSQGCSDDKNWLDFSSIFFKICRFRSSIQLSL